MAAADRALRRVGGGAAGLTAECQIVLPFFPKDHSNIT